MGLFGWYVRWIMVPGYAAVCALLMILSYLDGPPDELTAFFVGGMVLGVAVAAGAFLLWRGTVHPRGWKGWLSRVVGWLLLAAIAVPFISGFFVLGPLLVLALPVWVPLRSRD